MTRTRSRAHGAWLILAGVFAAGAVAGMAIHRLWLAPDAHAAAPAAGAGRCGGLSPDELVDLFTTRLGLDAGQQARLEPALRRGWGEIAAIYEGQEPSIDAIRQRTRDTIRGALRPEQLDRLARVTAELDERRAARRACRQEGIEDARRLQERSR